MTELENRPAPLHFGLIPSAQRTVLPTWPIQRLEPDRPVLRDSLYLFPVCQGDRPSQPIGLTSFHCRRRKSRPRPPRPRLGAPRSASLHPSTFAPSACFPMHPSLVIPEQPSSLFRG